MVMKSFDTKTTRLDIYVQKVLDASEEKQLRQDTVEFLRTYNWNSVSSKGMIDIMAIIAKEEQLS